ncbi:Oidioi.mRNA.OKI2018_I69.XSR.g16840.t1.cds [Oikopleura dioica]|uniref:Oidioi.mRNA.OKI2018_I69.XSR.g16840.t1.cds n=1 Tax=Oikopleura dioica TaxID=34765 RepID=A0ABN7SHD1_OIKDI|nr:Oidioi.mRNA.OKI2018_I69.XSR.g16840.t1.cds [Oikopleura dioica]
MLVNIFLVVFIQIELVECRNKYFNRNSFKSYHGLKMVAPRQKVALRSSSSSSSSQIEQAKEKSCTRSFCNFCFELISREMQSHKHWETCDIVTSHCCDGKVSFLRTRY